MNRWSSGLLVAALLGVLVTGTDAARPRDREGNSPGDAKQERQDRSARTGTFEGRIDEARDVDWWRGYADDDELYTGKEASGSIFSKGGVEVRVYVCRRKGKQAKRERDLKKVATFQVKTDADITKSRVRGYKGYWYYLRIRALNKESTGEYKLVYMWQ